MVSHEGLLASSQEVPSVNFPLHVTVDPQGPFDLGRDGLLVSEERKQIE